MSKSVTLFLSFLLFNSIFLFFLIVEIHVTLFIDCFVVILLCFALTLHKLLDICKMVFILIILQICYLEMTLSCYTNLASVPVTSKKKLCYCNCSHVCQFGLNYLFFDQ